MSLSSDTSNVQPYPYSQPENSRVGERTKRWGKSKLAFFKLHAAYENRVNWDIHSVRDGNSYYSLNESTLYKAGCGNSFYFAGKPAPSAVSADLKVLP